MILTRDLGMVSSGGLSGIQLWKYIVLSHSNPWDLMCEQYGYKFNTAGSLYIAWIYWESQN